MDRNREGNRTGTGNQESNNLAADRGDEGRTAVSSVCRAGAKSKATKLLEWDSKNQETGIGPICRKGVHEGRGLFESPSFLIQWGSIVRMLSLSGFKYLRPCHVGNRAMSYDERRPRFLTDSSTWV